MRTTATQLVTYWACPFLWHVSYEKREPLPAWGTRRRFGNIIHAAIAQYERSGRSLEKALALLETCSPELPIRDLEEARSILQWRHERAPEREGRPVLIEGSLRAQVDGHRLEVRMDRLDSVDGEYHLAEYKGGVTVDPELVRIQFLVLSTAILDVFGRAPATWDLELLRARQVRPVSAETRPDKLKAFTGRLLRDIESGDREPRPYDPSFCRRCPARSFCPRASPRPKPFTRREAPSQTAQIRLF